MPVAPLPIIPDPSQKLVDPQSGKVDATWYAYIQQLTQTANSSIPLGACYLFRAPENETVTIILNSPFKWIIDLTTVETKTGSATVQFAIDGTPLGGDPNSATPSEDQQTHDTDNVCDVGQDITITFSAVSVDCESLSVTLRGNKAA